MIWNVDSLSEPELRGSFYSTEQATDHNLYIRCVCVCVCEDEGEVGELWGE